MLGKKRNTKKHPCVIEGCWNTVGTEGRLCSACSSWWYRVVLKGPVELAEYVKRTQRFGSRLGSLRFRGLLSGRKERKAS